MVRGKNGFSLIEVILASATLAIIALGIFPQIYKSRDQTTSLASYAGCDAITHTILSNISSFKGASSVRNFYPGPVQNLSPSPPLLAGSSYWTQDPFCNPTREICDSIGHYVPTSVATLVEPFRTGNFQNIRSAVTWAGVRYDRMHPSQNCTAKYSFVYDSGMDDFVFTYPDTTKEKISDFFPAKMPKISELLKDKSIAAQRVTVEIEQIRADGPIDPSIHCAGSHLVRPRPESFADFAFSFDVRVLVEYTKKNSDGNALPASCMADMNLVYEFDNQPPSAATVWRNDLNQSTPGLPPNACTDSFACNPANPFDPACNSALARNINISIRTATEPGTLYFCRAERDPTIIAPGPWQLCGKYLNLGGKTQPPTFSAIDLATYQKANAGWELKMRWEDLPANGRYTVAVKVKDTAGNFTTNYADFNIAPNCGPAFLVNYCPDIRPPNGCGGTCVQFGTRDPRCPDPSEYFSCEDPCGMDCTNTHCAQAPLNRTGTRDYVQTPGDNMCPPRNTYCADQRPSKPCGGLCPTGTYNKGNQHCAGFETDACGNPGTLACANSPVGPRVPGDPGVAPVVTPTVRCPTMTPYCPAANTYCANAVMKDQCGNPCPTGTKIVNCCDRCDSSTGNFESEMECTMTTGAAACVSVPAGTSVQCWRAP